VRGSSHPDRKLKAQVQRLVDDELGQFELIIRYEYYIFGAANRMIFNKNCTLHFYSMLYIFLKKLYFTLLQHVIYIF